jgi:monoamine oxidase
MGTGYVSRKRSRLDTLRALGALGSAAALSPALTLTGCGRPKPDADVIVIGAGLSGLNAAVLLQDAGLDVLVVEADQRIGGRIRTLDDAPGRPEAGGSEIGAGYARVRDMVSRIGGLEFTRWLDLIDMSFALNIDGTLMNGSDWAGSPVNLLPEAERNTGPMGPFGLPMIYLAKDMPLPQLDSWLSPDAAQYDVPFDQYLRSLGASDEAVRLMASQVPSETVAGVSALWQLRAARYQGAVGSLQELESLKQGASRLPEGMAAMLDRDIRLGSPVSGIATERDDVTLTLADGTRLRAAHCICTVPLTILRQMQFSPVLPELQAEAFAQVPQGHNVSVYLHVKEPYWEEDGLPASLWTNQGIGRLFRYQGESGYYLWMNRSVSDPATRALDDESLMALSLRQLHAARPSTEGRVEATAVMNWSQHPWLLGHIAYRAPGQIRRYGNIVADAHGRIHFAGDHTAVLNLGMEGAMESGERAALEVLQRI